jgi:hypothetical protein
MGVDIWGSSEEWAASAPFADHHPGNISGFSSTVLSTGNTAVFTPMPMAITRIAMIVKPGVLPSPRRANRYKVSYPVVYLATVKKSHILAVKLGREEEEVITFGAYRNRSFIRIPCADGLIVIPEAWWGTSNLFKEMMEWGHGVLTTF